MKDCIFCKIAKKEIQQDPIYENERTIAFLDIHPATEQGGHTLVIPKKHYEEFTDISKEDREALIETVQKITKALMKFGKGVNVLLNNGKTAGQYVMHTHFHVIPRFEEDGILTEKWKTNKYKDGEAERIVKKIKSFL